MREYLLFRLYGPMAAWGDIAVGEYRPSHDHPSKSAIIGLLCAAVGIKRDQENELSKMANHYSVAVKTVRPGILLRDYHTIQTGRFKTYTRVDTRKQELEKERAEKINTILSSRDYYCDTAFVICVCISKDDAPYSLSYLRGKLLKPEFVLYLGRKSCPPSAPLEPQLTKRANNVHEAFEEANFRFEFPKEFGLSKTNSFYWEGEGNEGFDGLEIHSTIRRDIPLSRRRWQFYERLEHFAIIGEEK
jgi:CRISPR system Cascade subunit CasD